LTLAVQRRNLKGMARKLRVEYPGAIYHVMNRGDRREPIFKDDEDREACEKTGWEVHAYCLMTNHFHGVIETPLGNLVDGMKWFLGTYTVRFNRRHRLSGHLFSGRYKALMVQGSGGYLRTVCDYVHLNPERAKLLKADEPLRSYPWSSYRQYLSAAKKRAGWIRVDRLFGELGIGKDSVAGRREFEKIMEALRLLDDPEGLKALRRGWCVGSEEFRRELLEQMEGKMGRHHGGVERQETVEQRASRLLAEELKRRGWDEAELKRRKKSDHNKAEIAGRLRRETTVSWDWIARVLIMGASDYAAHCVRSILTSA
jgi:REP element-mobilizing transposase RayT